MIGSTRAGRRAEEFDALVEGRPGGTPSSELVALAGVVRTLRDVEPPVMRPEFAETLRAQLMLAAPEHLGELAASTASDSGRTASPSPVTVLKLRLARVAAVTCVIVGVTGGVAAASQSALPGDPLYGVKRGIEQAQLAFAQSDASEGERLVSQATTRLDEINDLALTRPDDPRTTQLIQNTLARFNAQAGDGADALIASYQNDSVEDSIVQLRTFADTSARELDQLSATVPAPVRPDVLDAARLLTGLDQEARDACGDCSSLAPLEVSDTVQQLAQTAQSLLGLPSGAIPDNDPGGTSEPGSQRDDGSNPDPTPAQEPPSGLLPSLPPSAGATQEGQSPGTSSGGSSGASSGGTQGGGQSDGGTSTKPPQLPELPLPSLPLPSLPLLGDLGGLLGGSSTP